MPGTSGWFFVLFRAELKPYIESQPAEARQHASGDADTAGGQGRAGEGRGLRARWMVWAGADSAVSPAAVGDEEAEIVGVSLFLARRQRQSVPYSFAPLPRSSVSTVWTPSSRKRRSARTDRSW